MAGRNIGHVEFLVDFDGKDLPLTPGMTATVEVQTGSRRVIDYLFAPIRETTSTAGHER